MTNSRVPNSEGSNSDDSFEERNLFLSIEFIGSQF